MPAGISVVPLTTPGDENVASKLWPSLLSFEPTACTSLTRSVVPAGITTGGGGGGGSAATGAAGGAASVGGASAEPVLAGGVAPVGGAAEDGAPVAGAGAGEFDEV